jgi:hypothetical protein
MPPFLLNDTMLWKRKGKMLGVAGDERLLVLNIVELLSQDLVHREHVHFVLLEYQLHLLVAADLAFIGGILQVSGFDVLPYFLDGLGA